VKNRRGPKTTNCRHPRHFFSMAVGSQDSRPLVLRLTIANLGPSPTTWTSRKAGVIPRLRPIEVLGRPYDDVGTTMASELLQHLRASLKVGWGPFGGGRSKRRPAGSNTELTITRKDQDGVREPMMGRSLRQRTPKYIEFDRSKPRAVISVVG
jgi:hypothetical protein